MILSMSEQSLLFCTTVIAGMIMGFLYDWIRVARRMIRHSYIMVQIEDIIYWILAVVGIFMLLLSRNYGEIRLFSLAGVLIGMVLYFFTVSHLFLKVSVGILNIIKKIILLLWNIIMTPVKLVLKVLDFPLSLVKKCGKKLHKSNKRVLKKVGLCARIKSDRLKKQLKVIFKKI